MQQLSLLAPQLVKPLPLVAQLGGPATHPASVQAEAAPEQAVPPSQLPLASHVCGALPMHVVCPGPQTPEQLPDAHVWPTQAAAFCQVPDGLHVWGCVLDEHRVVPGLHAAQAPPAHAGVLPEHPVVDAW